VPAKLRSDALSKTPLDPVHEMLLQALIAAQGTALLALDVVRELMIDVARLHPDPEKYIADLYDRVARHLDPKPADLHKPEKTAAGVARDFAGQIFATASRRLQNKTDQGQT
jgi:hypothetical protein